MKTFDNISQAIEYSYRYLANTGRVVKANFWQGQEHFKDMFEAMDLSFRAPMPNDPGVAILMTKANMPWSENHFQERIGGVPLNPPPSHKVWPFGKNNNEAFTADDKFDHTYPERFWPKFAGKDDP